MCENILYWWTFSWRIFVAATRLWILISVGHQVDQADHGVTVEEAVHRRQEKVSNRLVNSVWIVVDHVGCGVGDHAANGSIENPKAGHDRIYWTNDGPRGHIRHVQESTRQRRHLSDDTNAYVVNVHRDSALARNRNSNQSVSHLCVSRVKTIEMKAIHCHVESHDHSDQLHIESVKAHVHHS